MIADQSSSVKLIGSNLIAHLFCGKQYEIELNVRALMAVRCGASIFKFSSRLVLSRGLFLNLPISYQCVIISRELYGQLARKESSHHPEADLRTKSSPRAPSPFLTRSSLAAVLQQSPHF